jgi:mannose-1-phosphate guanylyltransferase/phosphomannomutase
VRLVILAGGKGTRLGLPDLPKPMVPIAGTPLLERLVEVGKASGFDDFLFLTGHLGERIEAHFGDGSRFGVKIAHLREQAPLGTAGALRAARHLLTEAFVLLYGDILLDVDLAHFVAFHRAHGGVASLFVHPNDHPHDSDLVEAGAGERITRFLPKPHSEGALLPNLVSAALYVMEPEAMDHVPEGKWDWGRHIFPAMVDAGVPLHAYRSLEYAKDMGTPDRLAKGERDIASGKVARLSRRTPKPAVFLDRDGVLNVERNGVHRPEDLHLLSGAAEAVAALNRAGVPAICVTNQPDIAKGFFTEADLRAVLAALDTALAARAGAWLDDVYYCPHHPEAGWPGEVAALKIACECRKPGPGMLKAAAAAHNIDLGRSWLIGDRAIDIAAARAAGTHAVLLSHPDSIIDAGAKEDCNPDLVTDSLGHAVSHILGALGQ